MICPTGTLLDASLAATSNKGAVTQNPSIKTTPVKMRSGEAVSGGAWVIAWPYDEAQVASIDFRQQSGVKTAYDRLGAAVRAGARPERGERLFSACFQSFAGLFGLSRRFHMHLGGKYGSVSHKQHEKGRGE